MDMIANASVLPGSVDIYVNNYSSWIGDRMLEAAASYGGPTANKIVDASMLYSDHAPFWDVGDVALLAIEEDFSPYYHSTNDTLDRLNLTFFTSVTKASLGLLAELAQPVRDGYPQAPLDVAAAPVVYSSLFNSIKTTRLTWGAQSDATGFNVYRSETSHLDYVKINASPVAGTSFADEETAANRAYYYVVTAVGPTDSRATGPSRSSSPGIPSGRPPFLSRSSFA